MSAPIPTAAPRVRVRRDGPADKPWRAELRDPATPFADELVGYFPTHPDAVRTGVTAARFVAAGIAWRAVGVTELDEVAG